MTSEEIRQSIKDGGRYGRMMLSGSYGAANYLLAEIAAQLAEINEHLRSTEKSTKRP